jgi:hypothetical protein
MAITLTANDQYKHIVPEAKKYRLFEEEKLMHATKSKSFSEIVLAQNSKEIDAL